LLFERLERRECPYFKATANATGTEITFTGTAGNDFLGGVFIDPVSNKIHFISDSPAKNLHPEGYGEFDTKVSYYGFAQPISIVIKGLGGNDYVDLETGAIKSTRSGIQGLKGFNFREMLRASST
jgi:hypothetical protein